MSPAREAALLGAVALGARLVAAWALGEGAPFGPDGTGAEAAVSLGGHLYPLHVAAIGLVGSARALSIAAGTVASLCLWVYGRRLGLGPAGGWLGALLPVAVYTGALSAGDAPALAVVTAGAALATGGRAAAFAGGVLAMASVALKPAALPALVLLLPRPLALAGAAAALPFFAGWLRPLWAPMPGGGLLGTWWAASGGRPPDDLLPWAWGGVRALAAAPLWSGGWLAPIALFAVRKGRVPTRIGAAGALAGALAVAAAFGDRLQPRYLEGAVWAALPWVGSLAPRWTAALLLLPTAAVITQVGEARRAADSAAEVPVVPVVPFPGIDAGALFDDASTPGATALRRKAADLARALPPGATVRVRRRPHGREGELCWPLRVARPDVVIEVVGTEDPEGL